MPKQWHHELYDEELELLVVLCSTHAQILLSVNSLSFNTQRSLPPTAFTINTFIFFSSSHIIHIHSFKHKLQGLHI